MARFTPKMRRFCLEYIIDFNGTQAAIRAGYSLTSAYSIAEENLKKPEVQAQISKFQKEREERTQITADKVLTELAYIAHSKITDVCTFGDKGIKIKDSEGLADWEIAAIAEVGQVTNGKSTKTYVKQHDKLKALSLLMKYLGLTSDFNLAIATFKKYGLLVQQTPDGAWEVIKEIDEEDSEYPSANEG